jgi:hypothetical protein
MKPGPGLVRVIAARLVAHAARVLPRGRSDWARAMQTEIEHIASNSAALRWAAGCVYASYAERMRVMQIGTLRISRWLLGVEMLMCFFWLTLMFAALVSRGAFGFTGRLPIDSWYVMALLGTLAGPIGLTVAFKAIVLDLPALSRTTLIALCLPVAWTLIAMLGQVLNARYPVEAIGAFVLFGLLPALGASHLVYLSRSRERSTAAA